MPYFTNQLVKTVVTAELISERFGRPSSAAEKGGGGNNEGIEFVIPGRFSQFGVKAIIV